MIKFFVHPTDREKIKAYCGVYASVSKARAAHHARKKRALRLRYSPEESIVRVKAKPLYRTARKV